MKVTALDCACIFVTGAGNSLMTHNTKAEGTDEPDKNKLIAIIDMPLTNSQKHVPISWINNNFASIIAKIKTRPLKSKD